MAYVHQIKVFNQINLEIEQSMLPASWQRFGITDQVSANESSLFYFLFLFFGL